MTAEPLVPEVPRLSGEWGQDAGAVSAWMEHLFRRFGHDGAVGVAITEAEADRQAEAANAIEELTQAISPTPTQAEVAAIQASLNEVVQFLRGSG